MKYIIQPNKSSQPVTQSVSHSTTKDFFITQIDRRMYAYVRTYMSIINFSGYYSDVLFNPLGYEIS